MDPEIASLQSIGRLQIDRELVPDNIWNKIVGETREMISEGLDLNPNSGRQDHLDALDRNTRFILGLNGIIRAGAAE